MIRQALRPPSRPGARDGIARWVSGSARDVDGADARGTFGTPINTNFQGLTPHYPLLDKR
jgi:hypothetical protein